MSESSDYTPASAWSGYSFEEARKSYDVHVGRSYSAAVVAQKTAADLVPLTLESASPTNLVISCDVTGSMGSWPATIFSKLPYLENEVKEYLGPETAISFAANGDVGDNYPVQIRPFVQGRELETELKNLIIESGGSGGLSPSPSECYELVAAYYARNVKFTNSRRKPVMIFIGDEHFHHVINKSHAKMANLTLEEEINTSTIFDELNQKFSVYLIRKPYTPYDLAITQQWQSVLGEDRIVMLDSPDRVVDVIFGLLAKETSKIEYFKNEIEDRQTAQQVATVYKSLETVHLMTENIQVDETKSVMHTALKGKLTKHLLP